MNWLAVYGDTDSAYVTNASRAAFVEFVRWCNEEMIPAAVKAQGCTVNEVKLEYEKEFDRIAFVSAKRYCGSLRHYKWMTTCTCTTAKNNPGAVDVKTMTCKDCGKVHAELPPVRGKPEIKGLEYMRGDASKLGRALQAHVVDLLVGGLGIEKERTVPTEDLDAYHDVIKCVRQYVLEAPLPIDEVKLSRGLSRPLREYAQKKKDDGSDASQPPHVVVAKILQARGEEVGEGTRIEFVVSDGSVSPHKVIPASDYTGSEADRYHLWESLVYPPTCRVLAAAFPDHDWESWGKVRPPKPRGRSKALPGQEGLPSVENLVRVENRLEVTLLGGIILPPLDPEHEIDATQIDPELYVDPPKNKRKARK